MVDTYILYISDITEVFGPKCREITSRLIFIHKLSWNFPTTLVQPTVNLLFSVVPAGVTATVGILSCHIKYFFLIYKVIYEVNINNDNNLKNSLE